MTKTDLYLGYKTNITDRINGGDFFAGADYDLDNTITPVINEVKGRVSDATFGMYTGSLGVDDVSKVRRVNNVAYVNKNYAMWNGTYYHNVTLSPAGSGSNEFIKFDGCSNGMQFPPQSDETKVRVYDNSMLAINEYEFSEDTGLSMDNGHSYLTSVFNNTYNSTHAD